MQYVYWIAVKWSDKGKLIKRPSKRHRLVGTLPACLSGVNPKQKAKGEFVVVTDAPVGLLCKHRACFPTLKEISVEANS